MLPNSMQETSSCQRLASGEIVVAVNAAIVFAQKYFFREGKRAKHGRKRE
jgi:hypothetical protein